MKPKILLGVTSHVSLKLMKGLPEYLDSAGWDVTVVTSFETKVRVRSDSGIKYVNIHMRREPNPIYDVFSLILWIKLVKSLNPDIIFTGTPKAGLFGMLAGIFSNVKCRIYHLRGLRFETTTGLKRTLLRTIEKISIVLSTKILSVSESLMKSAVEYGLADLSKFYVIGRGSSNGIDLSRFLPLESLSSASQQYAKKIGIDTSVPIIGYVGRINVDKGVGDLLQAHRNLIEKGVDCQLLLIGPIEGSAIKKFSMNLSNTHRVFAPGEVSNPEIVFPLFTAFCLPTYREGFPNVVLEAGAVSIPTVTTNATGAIDSVLHGVTGLIYTKGNVQELSECLQRFVQDPKYAEEIGLNAREFVTLYFERTQFWLKLQDFLLSELSLCRGDK